MSTSNKNVKSKTGGAGKKGGGPKNKKSALLDKSISFPEPKRSSLKVSLLIARKHGYFPFLDINFFLDNESFSLKTHFIV